MRFLALLKKEFRECLPWSALAAVSLLILGSLTLWPNAEYRQEYRYPVFERYTPVYGYELIEHPMSGVGIWLFMSAVGLGLALGVRQFWVAGFTGMWGFALHRSTARTTILTAKVCAGFISLITAAGLIWCYLFWRANLPDYALVPLSKRLFIEGWFIVGIGFMFYLGAGLSGLSGAHWYTTKLMGIGFATWMLVTLTQQLLLWGVVTLVIAVAVLFCLMWGTFLNREF